MDVDTKAIAEQDLARCVRLAWEGCHKPALGPEPLPPELLPPVRG